MTISVTINAVDVADLRQQLSSLLGAPAGVEINYVNPVASTPPKATAAKPKAEAPKPAPQPEPTVVEETVDPEPEVETSSDETPAADDPRTLSYDDDIKPAVLKVSAKHGRPGVEKLLAKFGAGNAREVPEDRWPEFMAEIEALLT